MMKNDYPYFDKNKVTDFMKVKLLHKNAVLPNRAHSTDAGLDVFAIENGVVHAGKDAVIRTGISIAIPDGWVSIVKEKSGRATKNKITVGACVIDCFSEDTKISTLDGEKTIGELSIGDVVISIDEENQEITKNKILNIIDSGIQEVFEISLENGDSIKLTDGSLVYTNVGWKFVRDLTDSDEILTFL